MSKKKKNISGREKKGNKKKNFRAQNDKSGKQLAQERYDRFRKF